MGTPAALGLHFLPRLSWIRLISWISLVFIILHQFLLICSLDHMCLQSISLDCKVYCTERVATASEPWLAQAVYPPWCQ